jgi:hypothetical protein
MISLLHFVINVEAGLMNTAGGWGLGVSNMVHNGHVTRSNRVNWFKPTNLL